MLNAKGPSTKDDVMRRKRKGMNQVWFNDRVREALEAAEQGRDDAAVDLLDRLAVQCHQAASDGLTEWHEIQALGLLGVELERQGAHAKAAAIYRRIADLRRAALQESGHGLAAALSAAAVASLRAGKRSTGRRLADEAIGLHDAYPLPTYDLEFLQRQLRHLRLPPPRNFESNLLTAWRTNNRVTIQLIERLPPTLWDVTVPGAPHRTIRAIGAHLHNARCRWVTTLGREHGITAPARVDHHRVTPRQLVTALKRSSTGIEALLTLGLAADGRVPPSKGYVWRNLSLDVGHVLTYFVAHEAHHRGQIVMVARQTGHRLPASTTSALWQWRMEGKVAPRRPR
jgi:uncharacterized damage-inducible protein DinB